MHAVFEVDDEVDKSRKGNKTNNIYKQILVCNEYYIVFEPNDVLRSGFYEPGLWYDSEDCFVDEVIKKGNKMAFYFKNTKKYIIKTEEHEKYYRTNKIWRFFKKEVISDKS